MEAMKTHGRCHVSQSQPAQQPLQPVAQSAQQSKGTHNAPYVVSMERGGEERGGEGRRGEGRGGEERRGEIEIQV